ncbi:MAG TPA: hypothetical protein PJ982_00870 [Lacipirellulaceae bacterium]|nr:hypothetical protein [Lacipirellulaceae bacterium]
MIEQGSVPKGSSRRDSWKEEFLNQLAREIARRLRAAATEREQPDAAADPKPRGSSDSPL